ncbi:class I SAM-dependent methyltransferase [Micromonospora echinofusca]|uniref:Methyltransferase domain-containing protein n=1 Tax=Micromonospora echinofusca TaxID=47858 RepID=A0A1C5G9S2_MICEH|nr:class I SAM-dependent methyltransferase [Micromonospora echinofusca]SCG16491.1 Methyltransferase domain-containing protein [Micromonospora echinofusca]
MPAAHAYHDQAGDVFAAHAADGSHNAYTDRPAMLTLASDVAGLRILDAGCGGGHYAAELVRRGAEVVAVDGSAALVRHARALLGDRAEIQQHDLDTPLEFAADASFDGVVCALVLHHLTDRAGFLAEVRRVLRPGGWFLLSTTHPTSDWGYFGGSYFDESWVGFSMADGITMRFQRMTLESLMTEVLDAGFVLERLVEPRAVETLRAINPERYERLTGRPSFVALRLRRP